MGIKKMMRQAVGFVLAVLLGLVNAAMGGSVTMNPGLWEWTADMEMPGMPMPLPPTSYTSCITQVDFVPKDSKLGQTCETIDLQTEGDTVSWNMTCTTPQGVATSQGQITYSGDSAVGEIQVSTLGMQMISKTRGRRLGPCQ
ncbi:MAG: DUF3617 family protein [Gammaproteobacteria bacterium]|nr:DUF3617 family protein [Gammaproteobacteria bacterium]